MANATGSAAAMHPTHVERRSDREFVATRTFGSASVFMSTPNIERVDRTAHSPTVERLYTLHAASTASAMRCCRCSTFRMIAAT